MSGWIKLHRQMLEWEWYDDMNTKCLYFHLLLKANHKDGKYRGVEITRGQHLTSLEKLSKETGLTISQIRTSIKKLKSTGEIADKSQAGGRMITVLAYDSYQGDDRQSDRAVTGESQASDNKQECNNKNNDKKPTAAAGAAVPYDAIQEVYNKRLGQLKGSRILSDKTKKQINAIWRSKTKHQSIDFWDWFFYGVNRVDNFAFLSGNNDRSWTANIEYLTRNSVFADLLSEIVEKQERGMI